MRSLVALAVVFALLAPAPLGLAASEDDPKVRVVDGVSVGGIRPGMTERQMVRRLGPADHRASGATSTWVWWDHNLTVQRAGGRRIARSISSTSDRARTERGIHPGSTVRALRRRYPGTRCRLLARRLFAPTSDEPFYGCRAPTTPHALVFGVLGGTVTSVGVVDRSRPRFTLPRG